MKIDPTLSLPRTLSMTVGASIMLTTRCLASAGMPMRVEASRGIRVRTGQANVEDDEVMGQMAVGGFPVVALQITALEPGDGQVQLEWKRPFGDDEGFIHHIDIRACPEGEVLAPTSLQIDEQLSQAPDPTRQEISRFLDRVDGRRPYGGKKFAMAEKILFDVGQNLAMLQSMSCTRDLPAPSVESLMSDRALEVLASMGMDRVRLHVAIDDFIKGRSSGKSNQED